MGDLRHDIEKYLRGEMTPAEMHLLEKRALDDPFLSDALEGGSMSSIDEFSADLSDLRKKIQQRIEPEKKTISLWYWSSRIAAGLLIISVASYIVFTLTDDKSLHKQLALNKEGPKPTIESSAQQPYADSASTAVTEPVDAVVKPESALNKATWASGDLASAPPVAKEEVLKEIVIDNEEKKEDEIVVIPEFVPTKMEGFVTNDNNVSDKKKARSDTYGEQTAPMMGKVAGAQVTPPHVIRGNVTDADDGAALPGVNVIVKGTDKGTVTDAFGNYELSIADTTKKELLFSFVGMQNQDVPLNATDSINVKLSPDYASLSEVVVVGYATREEGAVKEQQESTYEAASPEGGRKAFKTYLVTSLKYPPLAVENKIEGKVTVQFMIDTGGVLSDFRIIKGIGYGCDQEALRLIKNGPKWTATKRNDAPLRSKVKVKVRFKLPK